MTPISVQYKKTSSKESSALQLLRWHHEIALPHLKPQNLHVSSSLVASRLLLELRTEMGVSGLKQTLYCITWDEDFHFQLVVIHILQHCESLQGETTAIKN